MKCFKCGKEVKSEDLEWFGLDGDPIHKQCRPSIDREIHKISKMNESDFTNYISSKMDKTIENNEYCSETSSINLCTSLNTNTEKCKIYNKKLVYDFDFHAYKKCNECYNNKTVENNTNINDYTTVIELRDRLNQMIEEGFSNNIFCYCDTRDNKTLIPLKYWGIRPVQNKKYPNCDYKVLNGINGSLFAITQDGWKTASVGIPNMGINSLETKEKCDYQSDNAFKNDAK